MLVSRTSAVSLVSLVLGCLSLSGCGENEPTRGAAPLGPALEPAPTPIPVADTIPRPTASPLRDVRLDNIDDIRDIVLAGYDGGEWADMTAALAGARTAAENHVNATGKLPPGLSADADVLESIVAAHADEVSDQILAYLVGLRPVTPQSPELPFFPAAADSGGGGEDQDAVDSWTLVHFTSGCVLGELGLDFGTTLTLLILWEIVEPVIWPGWNESPENQVTDVVVGMIGWWICSNDSDELEDAVAGGLLR